MRGTYRGYDIVSMPPPSSGGVKLIEMLNILEGYDLAHDDRGRRRIPDDRSDEARLCGSRAVSRRSRRGANPVARLTSKDYAAQWRATIDPDARDAGKRRSMPAAAPRRGPQHHAFLRGRPIRQRRLQHLHAQFQLWRRPRRRGHRHPAEQRTRRFRRQAGSRQRLRAASAMRPTRRDPANGRCRR